jgi:hypothetical protein
LPSPQAWPRPRQPRRPTAASRWSIEADQPGTSTCIKQVVVFNGNVS